MHVHRSARAIVALLIAPALAAAAGTSAALEPGAARIPEANHGGIRSWRADAQRGAWVQDRSGHWFYARFVGVCAGLNYPRAVRFITGPGGALDRLSAVRTRETALCPFLSFEPSAAPAAPSRPDITPSPGAQRNR